MGASDRARTETRAFLMVASADCSMGFEPEFNLGTLLAAQPWDSDSGLSSLPTLLPSRKLELWSWSNGIASLLLVVLTVVLFWGVADRVLSSDEELLETWSSVSAVALGPKSKNCLSCFTSWWWSPALLFWFWSLSIIITKLIFN